MGKGWLVPGILSVVAIYAAGYVRTQQASSQFEERATSRRRPLPAAHATAPVPVSQPVPASAGAPPPAPVRVARAVAQAKVPKPDDPIPAPWETDEAEPRSLVAPAPPAQIVAPVTAPASVAPPPAPPPPAVAAKPAAAWKDGTYLGWGHSRHGDIQASVLIENGRIVSSKIAQCLTRYSCDVIDTLIPQPPQRQSAEVDAVGGATQSSDAFYYAVNEALAKAK